MPPVSLTLRQVTSVIQQANGVSYQVTNTVTDSVGIDLAVFVFRADNAAFSRYATAPDMALPDSQPVAVADGADFFRQTTVTRIWPTILAMNQDLADTQRRLRSLARETSAVQGSIVIDQTVEISEG